MPTSSVTHHTKFTGKARVTAGEGEERRGEGGRRERGEGREGREGVKEGKGEGKEISTTEKRKKWITKEKQEQEIQGEGESGCIPRHVMMKCRNDIVTA